MTDYSKLVEALRCKVGITEEETKCEKCPYGTGCDDCDVERYCNDAAAAIEELQAEVERLEPKRGEWIHLDDADERKYSHICSVCHRFNIAEGETEFYHYCPNCGAKMEVQE